MHLFISARQSLTAMDAVLARVARAWELSQQELWAFMLMVEANEPVGASWLGVQSGRARQQLHRALQGLEARGLVEGVGHGTNALRWSLTQQGHQRGQRLRAVFDEWVSMMGRRVDVPRLEADLMRVVAVLVNRPQDGAWVNGVTVPYSVRHAEVRMDGRPSLKELATEGADGAAQLDQPLDSHARFPGAGVEGSTKVDNSGGGRGSPSGAPKLLPLLPPLN
ncbi:MAG: hypothetical protein IT380_29275 [Myxococcales bacterium]|nr:hypothetical protein [Myxococcales bacterium]